MEVTSASAKDGCKTKAAEWDSAANIWCDIWIKLQFCRRLIAVTFRPNVNKVSRHIHEKRTRLEGPTWPRSNTTCWDQVQPLIQNACWLSKLALNMNISGLFPLKKKVQRVIMFKHHQKGDLSSWMTVVGEACASPALVKANDMVLRAVRDFCLQIKNDPCRSTTTVCGSVRRIRSTSCTWSRTFTPLR